MTGYVEEVRDRASAVAKAVLEESAMESLLAERVADEIVRRFIREGWLP